MSDSAVLQDIILEQYLWYGFLLWQAMSIYVEMPGTVSNNSCRVVEYTYPVLEIITVASTSWRLWTFTRTSSTFQYPLWVQVLQDCLVVHLVNRLNPFYTGNSRPTLSHLTWEYIALILDWQRYILGGGSKWLSSDFVWGGTQRIHGTIFKRIPNLLANRLFLNLRTHQNPRYGLSSNDPTLPAPSLAQNRPNRFLGNIGEPLDYDQWDDFLDDEDVHDEAAGNNTDSNRAQDPLMTFVPVVYEGPDAINIEMVPMQREPEPVAGPSNVTEIA
ncbi:uncharacterized protein STEHIDRAFT_116161 [Stereum hirsutum FP-91666 SS1]|uniref:Uncharacterized protein n=1 Tax=Stereum hirsutum (strain FP-91666) TaxID=721885 RepID=R7RX92_STEHR|nr:uncharacterized protein STEHIDRAFT_116161 [Stereum hirsutum FP-91666 SS1]EIM79964.1 hypothetical protein STEHIDRAFT_116161 [Stereum hirsutum FP-91666 SS1]